MGVIKRNAASKKYNQTSSTSSGPSTSKSSSGTISTASQQTLRGLIDTGKTSGANGAPSSTILSSGKSPSGNSGSILVGIAPGALSIGTPYTSSQSSSSSSTTSQTPSSGDWSYGDWNYKNFKTSSRTNRYNRLLKETESSKPEAYQSAYESTINEILDTIKNRGSFDVKKDANYDALYNQAAERYQAQAQRSMRDTLAAADAQTGGYGSSYGQAVAQQAYDRTMEGLNDRNQQLIQLAYQMYLDDRANDYNKLNAYQSQDNTAYSRYRDTYNDWLTDRDYYANQYQQGYSNDRSAYENDRALSRSNYENDRALSRSNYENDRAYSYQVSQNELNRETAEKERQDSLYQTALGTALSLAQNGQKVPAYITEAIDRYNAANGYSTDSASSLSAIAAQALAQQQPLSSSSSGGGSRKSSKKSASRKKSSSGDGPLKIGNQHSDDWVRVGGYGRLSYQELEKLVDDGKVTETLRDGKYYYAQSR